MTNSAASAFSAPPAATEASTPAEQPSATTDASNAGDWYTGIKNEERRNWAQAKGWKDPEAVVDSAYNLEKLIGHDKAGRTVVLPGEDAKPEELAAFYKKMGVPDTVDGYKLPVPEGMPAEFAGEAAKWMHESGIPPKQAEKLAGRWNDYMAQQQAQLQEQQAVQSEQEFNKTMQSWGKEADANIELGKRFAQQFIPAKTAQERQEIIGKIESAIGTAAMLHMFANAGKGLGEHMAAGMGGSGGFGTSPGEAKGKIQSLLANKEWSTGYINGDKDKVAEMTRLQKAAYPE
jgi:hypothetical protein